MKRIYSAAAGLSLLAAALLPAGIAAADPQSVPTGYGQSIDAVVQRALSQRGVPYVYGGGGISGPTTGARPGIAARPGVAGLPGSAVTPGTPGVAGLPGSAVTPGVGTVPAATTVGFDSSGLIQYAFAAGGIKMPRTSGEQCSVGHKVAPAQARPGDLLCFGPGGSQSVALYLGNNQMIEGTEPAVTVSPARTTNMVPYLTRIIGS